MLKCGLYDGSGEFAFRVGLLAKSGVGGGILAVAPGIASLTVWSPGVDVQGNSLLGISALELLAHQTDWSVFGPDQNGTSGWKMTSREMEKTSVVLLGFVVIRQCVAP